MRILTATLCLTIAVLLFITIGGESDDFQKRMDAAKKEEGAISLYGPAQRRWKSLAENGDAFAQYNLGNMYRVGHGLWENDKTAVKWYTLAAEQGHASAQYFLGWMYADGEGVIQDNVRAHMWLNIAALLGNKTASENSDLIAERMTQFQIETAQRLARECVKKKYKGC